jgi:glycosyltransferase involved in cell wall biosynthesis
MNSSKEHLVIVRTSGSVLNLSSYNCQELGLAKTLIKKGLRVSLIMAGESKKKETHVVDNKNIEVYFLPFISLSQSLAWFKHTEQLLIQLQPTFLQIHEFGMFMSYRIVLWAKKHQLPCFLIQGSYKPTQKIIFKQLELLFNITFGKYILKNVDSIGCKTKMASDYIHKYINRPTLQTNIGLDIEKFSNCEEHEEKDWRKELKIETKKVMLYVGSIEPRRNILFIIDILVQLPNNYVLIIVGDGIQADAVRRSIKDNHLEQRCYMLGKMKQEQLSSIYKSSDLLLLASDYEIYGMVILEAMYFGLPVISTLNAGAEEIINNNINGFIIPNKKVSSWCDHIIMACTNKNVLHQMKKEAYLKIVNNLTWEKTATSFIQLYDGLFIKQ